jgi:hypothetical protein
MTPERVAQQVQRWVRLYTRNLAAPIAERRVAEIEADMHDHIAHERAAGIGDGRIALGIASRAVRGVAADAVWRRRQTKEEAMKTMLARPAARVALGVALILSLPLIGMLLSDDVVWSLGDFIAAGVLLATIGIAIELAVKRAGNLAIAFGIAALGVAAGAAGEADDAPGLVLLGLLLIASGVAIGVRTARQP